MIAPLRTRTDHTCHWPGCEKVVSPALWGCKRHWYQLPKELRDRIWAAYRPGQEITKDPSSEYLEAADAVQRWIREHGERRDFVGKAPPIAPGYAWVNGSLQRIGGKS